MCEMLEEHPMTALNDSLIALLEARKAQVDEISAGNADALGRAAGLAEAIAIARQYPSPDPSLHQPVVTVIDAKEIANHILAAMREHDATPESSLVAKLQSLTGGNRTGSSLYEYFQGVADSIATVHQHQADLGGFTTGSTKIEGDK
jgi:hypothetical protein